MRVQYQPKDGRKIRLFEAIRRPEYLFNPRQIWRRLRRHSLCARNAIQLAWGLPVEVDPSSCVGLDVINIGLHDRVVTEAICRLLDPHEVAFDVGANIGQNVSMMALVLGPRGRVVAFEPGPTAWGLTLGGQLVRIALTGNDGFDDGHAAESGYIAEYVMNLQIHLGQRLVHMLHVDCGAVHQAGAVTAQGAKGADLAVGAEGGFQKPHRVKVLQPLTVLHVGFSTRYVLDVFGVDKADTNAGLLQDLVRRNPIDPGRLHGYGGDAALNQPRRHGAQVPGEGLEAANWLRVATRRHRHIDLRGPHIDARRVVLDVLQTDPCTRLPHVTSHGLRPGPDCEAGNLLNGIAALTRTSVTNVAITKPGTMLRSGLSSTNAQPAYFHTPQPNPD